MSKTDCTPHCPARLFMEEEARKNPVATHRFLDALRSQMDKYDDVPYSEEIANKYLKEQTAIAKSHLMPTPQELMEKCLCGYFKEK